MTDVTMPFLLFVAVLWLSFFPLNPGHTAEVSCQSHYSSSAVSRWPSGEPRPTESSCAGGLIFGPIERGDYEKVRRLYQRNHPFLSSFWLTSPGGDVAEAVKIGRLFRKYLLAAYAPTRIYAGDGLELFANAQGCENENGTEMRCSCASACALIWFGAVQRAGDVGLHRPTTDDPSFKALGPKEGADAYRRIVDTVREYMDEMEVPKPMIEEMVATSSADIKWVDSDADNLERPPGQAEWEDATCGGFSTKEYVLLSRLGRPLLEPRTNLSPGERTVWYQLNNKYSKWFECRRHLLAISRAKLLPP